MSCAGRPHVRLGSAPLSVTKITRICESKAEAIKPLIKNGLRIYCEGPAGRASRATPHATNKLVDVFIPGTSIQRKREDLRRRLGAHEIPHPNRS